MMTKKTVNRYLVLITIASFLTLLIPYVAISLSVWESEALTVHLTGHEFLYQSGKLFEKFSAIKQLRILLMSIYGLSLLELLMLIIFDQKNRNIPAFLFSVIQFLVILFLFVRMYIESKQGIKVDLLLVNCDIHINMITSGLIIQLLLSVAALIGNGIHFLIDESDEEPEVIKPEYPSLDIPLETAPIISHDMFLGSQRTAKGKLRGKNGVYAGISVVLEEGEQIVIGRDPQICNIVLDSPSISKTHCFIQLKPDKRGYAVMDQSLNGTYLADGSRLPKGIYLDVPGDTLIYVGSVDNTFLLAAYE